MAGAVSSSSSGIVHDPMRVSRTVWLNVSTTSGNRYTCIEVAINRVLE